jgi:hypothetical protein
VTTGQRSTDEPWETRDERLTFGYVDVAGRWVPGILENIRDLQTWRASAVRRDATINKYCVYFIVGVLLLQFLGIATLQALIKLVHSGG